MKRRQPMAAIADINVTPFVDVLLVLLVIFMITAPIITQSLHIQLPKEDLRSNQVTKSRKFIVSINRKGKTYLNEKRMNTRKLTAEAILWKKKYPREPIFIKADHRVDYGRVMEVMSAMKNTGITNIGLLIQKSQDLDRLVNLKRINMVLAYYPNSQNQLSFYPFFLVSLFLHIVLVALFIWLSIVNESNLKKKEILEVSLHYEEPVKTKKEKVFTLSKKKSPTFRKFKAPETRSFRMPGFLRSNDLTRLRPKDSPIFQESDKKEFQDLRETAEENREEVIDQQKPDLTEKEQKEDLEKEIEDSKEIEPTPPQVETTENEVETVRKESPRNLRDLWKSKRSDQAYYDSLEKIVKANWILPETKFKDFLVIAQAKIGTKGNLLEIKIIQSSNSPLIDAAAERAITVSTPFPEFPKHFDKKRTYIHVRFRFTP